MIAKRHSIMEPWPVSILTQFNQVILFGKFHIYYFGATPSVPENLGYDW